MFNLRKRRGALLRRISLTWQTGLVTKQPRFYLNYSFLPVKGQIYETRYNKYILAQEIS